MPSTSVSWDEIDKAIAAEKKAKPTATDTAKPADTAAPKASPVVSPQAQVQTDQDILAAAASKVGGTQAGAPMTQVTPTVLGAMPTVQPTGPSPKAEAQTMQDILAQSATKVGGTAAPQAGAPITQVTPQVVGAMPQTAAPQDATAQLNAARSAAGAASKNPAAHPQVKEVMVDPKTGVHSWYELGGPDKGKLKTMSQEDWDKEIAPKPTAAATPPPSASATPTPSPAPATQTQTAGPVSPIDPSDTYVDTGTMPDGSQHPHYRKANGMDYYIAYDDPAKVGYWVGGFNTPMQVYEKPEHKGREQIESDPMVIALAGQWSAANNGQEPSLAQKMVWYKEHSDMQLSKDSPNSVELSANVQSQDIMNQLTSRLNSLPEAQRTPLMQRLYAFRDKWGSIPGIKEALQGIFGTTQVPQEWTDIATDYAQLNNLMGQQGAVGRAERVAELQQLYGALGNATENVQTATRKIQVVRDQMSKRLADQVADAINNRQKVPTNAWFEYQHRLHPTWDLGQYPAQFGAPAQVAVPGTLPSASPTPTPTPSPPPAGQGQSAGQGQAGKFTVDNAGYTMIHNNAEKAQLPAGTKFVFVDQNGKPIAGGRGMK